MLTNHVIYTGSNYNPSMNTWYTGANKPRGPRTENICFDKQIVLLQPKNKAKYIKYLYCKIHGCVLFNQ